MKKVIALVIDTELTNKQIELAGTRCHVTVTVTVPVDITHKASEFLARNVRVLDSGRLTLPVPEPNDTEGNPRPLTPQDDIDTIGKAIGLMGSMTLSSEHSTKSELTFAAAKNALQRLGPLVAAKAALPRLGH